jgi:hypothetical protein
MMSYSPCKTAYKKILSNMQFDAKTVAVSGSKYLVKRYILHNPALIGGALGGTIGFIIGGTCVNKIISWYKKRKEIHKTTSETPVEQFMSKYDRLKRVSGTATSIALHIGGAFGGMLAGASVGSAVGAWTALAYKFVTYVRYAIWGYTKVMKYDTH